MYLACYTENSPANNAELYMNHGITNIVFFLVLSVLGAAYIVSAPKSTADNYIPQDFDVLNYDIGIEIDSFGADSLRGSVNIELEWLTDAGGVFYLDIHELDIAEIKRPNSEPIDFEIKFDTIDKCEYISIDQLPSGRDTIMVTYATALEPNDNTSGLMVNDNMYYVLGVGFFDEWVSMGRDWFPCYDHPSDKATFNTVIATPIDKPQLFAVANGKKVFDESAESWRIRHFRMNQQMTTYNATFAIGDFKVIDQQYPVYCEEEVYDETKEIVDILPIAVSTLEEAFGPYPFETLGYVMVEEGTIEQQALIMQQEDIVVSDYRNNDTTTLTTVHELAHQWFGNDVSILDFRNAWLSESFATYAEIIWIEKLQGRESALDLLYSKLTSVLAHNSFDIPLYGYDRSRYTNYPLAIYFKGAVVLDMLRHYFGDEQFYGLLQAYMTEYSGSSANTEMFLDLAEEFAPTGFDLEGFADSYIYGGGFASVSVESNDVLGNNGNVVGIAISKNGERVYSPLPLELVLLMEDGTEFSIIADMSGKEYYAEEQLPDGYSVNDIRRVYTNHNRYKNKSFLSYAWLTSYTDVDSEDNGSEKPNAVQVISSDRFTAYISELENKGMIYELSDMNGRLLNAENATSFSGMVLIRYEARSESFFVIQ
jgi:aminopeptidase N